MKNTIYTLILLTSSAVFCFGQVKPFWTAKNHTASSSDDMVNAIAADNGGNVYVTGQSYGVSSQEDYLTIKYSPSGEKLWEARYNGPVNSFDIPHSIAVDNSGNVIVTGYSDGGASYVDIATVKYNSAGNMLWAARYSSSAESYDGGKSTAVDAQGNIFVTGYGSAGNNMTDIITVKYDPSGVLQWSAVYDGPAHAFDEGRVLTLSPSGNIFVGGVSYRDSSSVLSSDYTALKYNSAGILQWAVFYNGTANRTDLLNSLKIDASENVYVTGSSEGNGTFEDITTLKISTAGQLQWTARYNGVLGFEDKGTSLTVDNQGNVIVSGFSTENNASSDATVIKYSSSGAFLWKAHYGGAAQFEDAAQTIAVDAEGNIYAAGVTTEQSYDFLLLKYSAAGNLIWNGNFDWGNFSADGSNTMIIDSSGNIYTAGFTNNDFLTLKYSQVPPAVPILIFPPNDTSYSSTPAFIRHRWSKSLGNERYRFQLALDSLFNSIVTDDTTLTDTLKVSINLAQNTRYWWRVNAKNYFGPSAWSAAWKFSIGVIGIEPISSNIPGEFRLYSNFPNPFNPSTVIKFDIPPDDKQLSSHVKLDIFNVLGQNVTTLVNEELKPGTYEVTFNAVHLPSGIYFCRIAAGGNLAVNKMMLTK
jgi:uncharacterized delta-60 repeat protein